MQIDWNKIKKEYPKSYNKFMNDNNLTLYNMGNNEFYPFGENDEDICYCDLEKFFDDNGIINEINYWHKDCYNFTITNYKTNRILYEEQVGKIQSRQEAKLQAIYKAFEIMEEMEDKND